MSYFKSSFCCMIILRNLLKQIKLRDNYFCTWNFLISPFYDEIPKNASTNLSIAKQFYSFQVWMKLLKCVYTPKKVLFFSVNKLPFLQEVLISITEKLSYLSFTNETFLLGCLNDRYCFIFFAWSREKSNSNISWNVVYRIQALSQKNSVGTNYFLNCTKHCW